MLGKARHSSRAAGLHHSPLVAQKYWSWTTTPERWNSAGADIRSTGPDRGQIAEIRCRAESLGAPARQRNKT